MTDGIGRRSLLKAAPAAVALAATGLSARAFGAALPASATSEGGIATPMSDVFPSHAPELVREVVTVAHFNLNRLKEVVDERPALAKAAWDWGFGDWEDALGAASHMGNRAIAEYLIGKGARPSIFSAAMLGELDVVKGFIAAQPGAQAIRGPHSISLLAHARVGGDAAKPVYEYLQSLGGADTDAPVALSEAETAKLVGTYSFGIGITQQVIVDADIKMYANSKMYTHAPQLNWTRKGTMPRPIFHLGNLAFCPAGAQAARIQFTEDAQGVVMNVTDGELMMTARRSPDGK